MGKILKFKKKVEALLTMKETMKVTLAELKIRLLEDLNKLREELAKGLETIDEVIKKLEEM